MHLSASREDESLSDFAQPRCSDAGFPPKVASTGESDTGILGDPDWFVVYTTSRHEKRVAQHFQAREVQYFLPVYCAERRWNDGSRVRLELPLFPCYVFVRTNRKERTRVLQTPGVLSFVAGTGGEPAVFPENLIESLRQELPRRRAEPHALPLHGMKARIRSGPFTGMEGIVVRTKGGYRAVLTLDSIKQSFAVEVSIEELELF